MGRSYKRGRSKIKKEDMDKLKENSEKLLEFLKELPPPSTERSKNERI